MNFTCKMEFNIRVIIPLGIKEPFALRQVNQMPVFVIRNIGMFEANKFFEFFGVFTRYPTGFVKWKAVELNGCAVFMQ